MSEKFFDDHVCTPTCVLHDVLFPQQFISEHKQLRLTEVYDGAPDEVIPMTLVTLLGAKHPNEGMGNEDTSITIGLVSEFVLDFVASVVTEVEFKQPGFLAAIVATVNSEVMERATASVDIHQQRLKQVLHRWADDVGIDLDSIDSQMGWNGDD